MLARAVSSTFSVGDMSTFFQTIEHHALYIFLGQRPAAIVSPQAGTTRDVLESTLDIFGYPVVIRFLLFALY